MATSTKAVQVHTAKKKPVEQRLCNSEYSQLLVERCQHGKHVNEEHICFCQGLCYLFCCRQRAACYLDAADLYAIRLAEIQAAEVYKAAKNAKDRVAKKARAATAKKAKEAA